MIKNSLRAFVDEILKNQRISKEDVQKLQREILADGITCREEADTLIALERAIDSEPAFGDYLVITVADFRFGARVRRATSTGTRRAGSPPRFPAATARPRPRSASPSKW